MASLLLADVMVLPCSSGSSSVPSSANPRATASHCFVPHGGGAASQASSLRRIPLRVRNPSCKSRTLAAALGGDGAVLADDSVPSNNGVYMVGDFMTKKDDLRVVKPTTTVDEALEMLVSNRITGFPVIDDDWKLVGVVSDYDLLALDSISGGRGKDTDLFPEVDSTWKTFSEIQKLLSKTNGKVVGDLMTPAPLVVHEATNLEHAARILLETKYRRLPVVDSAGNLVGIITRGNVIRAALQINMRQRRGLNPRT